jgi:hypothetical protein
VPIIWLFIRGLLDESLARPDRSARLCSIFFNFTSITSHLEERQGGMSFVSSRSLALNNFEQIPPCLTSLPPLSSPLFLSIFPSFFWQRRQAYPPHVATARASTSIIQSFVSYTLLTLFLNDCLTRPAQRWRAHPPPRLPARS